MLPDRRFRRLILLLFAIALLFAPDPAEAQGQQEAISADQLPEAIAAARPGDTLLVDGGTLHGSLVVDKPVILTGVNWPTIDGGGTGTVLLLRAPGIVVRGFVIRGSGNSLDAENAGVAGEAPEVVIEYNRFEDTLFGIYLREASGSAIRGNELTGKALDLPRRGDAIRVWFSNDVLIENNVVRDSRDVVLWYSTGLTLRDNIVTGGRYGLHFMYCDDATIERNLLQNNSVGAYLMYSRRLVMTNNTVAANRGPSGYGIGMKDLDDAIVVDNRFVNNRVGAHLDNTPREVDSLGLFEGNVFAYNDIGINLMPAVRRNSFLGNSFINNGEQVAVGGGAPVDNNRWSVDETGNYWSDYAGYDADGDGRGDIPFRSDHLFDNLVQQNPALRLFIYSPVTDAIDLAADTFPLVKPRPVLVDEAPLTAPRLPDTPTLPRTDNRAGSVLAMVILITAMIIAALPQAQPGRYRFVSDGRDG